MASIELTVNIETHSNVNGDAEELGEQFSNAIESLVTGPGESSFATWIYEIMIDITVVED